MKSQTERPVRRPGNQRSTKNRPYRKQTAHVEARRDGKPLIFGWGKHLSHSEKMQLQRRATWGMTALIALLLVITLVGFWINLNIIQPGLAFTTVNGHAIPQSQYRKLVAVKTQLELNKIYGPHGLVQQSKDVETQDAAQLKIISDTTTQINQLNTQIKALPKGPSAQRTSLTNQLTALQKKQADAQAQHTKLGNQYSNLTTNTIPIERQGFTQSQIGNDSATWLQDDELIREWLATQSSAIQAKINPTASAVNAAFNDLKANMPTTNGYNTFIGQMGISDSDVRDMLTVITRRTNMQTYLKSLVVSPTYQVLARAITTDTQKKADQILQQLKKSGGSDFGSIAKAQSSDATTSSKGGDLGWLARGQYAQNANAAVVENWMFDPARQLNQISPALFENGSYHIVQIMNIDPSRAVDSTTLQTLQNNALQDWLYGRRGLSGANITTADQNMLFDANNLPPTSILPSSAPAVTPAAGAGAP